MQFAHVYILVLSWMWMLLVRRVLCHHFFLPPSSTFSAGQEMFALMCAYERIINHVFLPMILITIAGTYSSPIGLLANVYIHWSVWHNLCWQNDILHETPTEWAISLERQYICMNPFAHYGSHWHKTSLQDLALYKVRAGWISGSWNTPLI